MHTVNLTSHFLIAMPGMVDPYFSKTLTFICEHNEQGALGVVVNAVVDALSDYGIRHLEMPMTPARIWQAIEDAKRNKSV